MGQLDASIVTLTYRPLSTEFGASLAAVQWVSLAYLLALATLLIPVGRLADAHGRKLMYLYGFVIFTVASAACGLAPRLSALIAFRIVQGAGAALLQANSVALVTTSAPPGRARAALGVQGAAQAIGLALGPTVGGLLVSTLGWRWVFGINVPVGVVAVAAAVYLLPRTSQRTPITGWDCSGLVLLATATTTVLLVISDASGLTLPRWGSIMLLVLAAASTAGFLVRERRAATPLLDLSLLRMPTVSTGLLAALCCYLVLFWHAPARRAPNRPAHPHHRRGESPPHHPAHTLIPSPHRWAYGARMHQAPFSPAAVVHPQRGDLGGRLPDHEKEGR
jgi:MFS family permease